MKKISIILFTILMCNLNLLAVSISASWFSAAADATCGAGSVGVPLNVSGNLTGTGYATYRITGSSSSGTSILASISNNTGTFSFTMYPSPLYTNSSWYYTVTLQGSYNGTSWSNIISANSNTKSYTVNNVFTTNDVTLNLIASPIAGNLPATILRCASGNNLYLRLPTGGTSYSYTIEKGVFVSNAFAALGGANNTFTKANTVGSAPINTDLLSPTFALLRLSEWSGYVRVTATLAGPCNVTPITITKIYNLDGSVEFTQKPTSGCLNTQVVQRYTDITFTNNNTGVFTTAPCLQGWMGATTCGINISSGLTGITKSQVKVDRVDANGSIITPDIFNVTNYNGLFASVDFNNHFQFGILQTAPPPASGTGTYNYSINSQVNFVVSNNWFSSNYNIIKNAASVFRITVNATNSSGTCSSIGYFKIADGGTIGQFWKKENNLSWDPLEGLTTSNSILEFTPNPTNNSINFYNSEVDATLVIYDIFGKKIMEKQSEIGFNNINIVDMPNGQYFVNLSSIKGLSKGKFIKQ
jgi:Secretion system C-terminal sorting domain